MMVFEAEARRWGAQLMRTRLVWWLVLASVVVPLLGALVVAHFMGPPPLVNFAVWVAVLPFCPFLWIYVGLQLVADDEPIEVGALKRSWSTGRLGVWMVQAAFTGLLGLGGAVVSTVVLTAAVPAWHSGPLGGLLSHGLAAGLVFGSTNVLMLAWGMAWRALLPGVWSGMTAFALPLLGFLGNFVLGEIQWRGGPLGRVIMTSVLVTDPWGYFVEKGTDVWGFGPYAALAHRTGLLMLVGMVLAVGVALWKQLGPSRRVRAVLVGTVVLAGALSWGVLEPMVGFSRVSATPSAAGSLAHQGLRQEHVNLTVGLRDGIHATATVWPRSAGITALWLNPHLTIVRVSIGGRTVATRRTASGWLYVSRTHEAMTVQYQGNPVSVAGGFMAPAVASFANGTGALLDGGGWYPLTGQEVAHPYRPPIARYGLQVTHRGPGTVLTNVGNGTSRKARWRMTTGLEVLAGRFTPVTLPGLTLWSGSTASSVWQSDRWSPNANIPTDSGLIVSAGRPSLRQEARLFAGSRRATVVSFPWWDGVPLMALGNPNELRLSTFAWGPGALGLLQTMHKVYQQMGPELNSSELAGFWSQWSPTWLMPAQWTALPHYQRPAQAVVLTMEQSWLTFPTYRPAFASGKFGLQHIPPLFNQLAAIPVYRRGPVWREFLTLVKRGQWPTWTTIDHFVRHAVVRP